MSPPSGTQSLRRAMAVLDAFAGGVERQLTEVARITGLPLSTTHRILYALVDGGYLARSGSERYRVGSRLVDLVPPRRLADRLAPQLFALAARTTITVHLGIAEGDRLVTILSARPLGSHSAAELPTGPEPLHATAMGKAILAWHPGGPRAGAREAGRLDRYTERTITNAEDLADELTRVRGAGFAVDDGEHRQGIRAVAVPLVVPAPDLPELSPSSVAIGVQGEAERLGDAAIDSLVPVLRAAAGAFGRRLADGRTVPA